MTKYTITGLIAFTVVMAGIFAFMPVQQASTVHTTIQAAQGTPFSVTDTITFTAAERIVDSQLDCTATCFVTSILVQATASDQAGNIAHIQNIEIDGIELGADLANAGNGAVATYDLTDTANAAALDLFAEELWLETFLTRDLITAVGASPAVDAIEQVLHSGLGNGIVVGSSSSVLPVGDTTGIDDIVVEIECTLCNTSATITVTYAGGQSRRQGCDR